MNLPPLDPLATDPESLLILRELVRYTQPQLVVEAGTYLGHFAILAAEVAPDSTIHTADTIDHSRRQFCPSNVQFHLQDFSEMLVSHIEKGSVDFAFVDSGPPFAEDWEDCIRYRHYKDVMPYMKAGGLVVSHDMNSTDWYGADKIIEQSSLRLAGGRGITIQQIV